MPPAALPVTVPAPVVAPPNLGVITGRVLTLNGLAAANVAVEAVRRPSRDSDEEPLTVGPTKSDADGAFVLADVPVAFYTVVARDGSATAMAQASLYDYAPRAEVTLVLREGGPIAGRVTAEGAPVIGAALTVLEHNGSEASRDARTAVRGVTDDAGAFRFEGLERETWTFHVTAAGFAPVVTEAIAVGTEDAEIAMEPGANVEGRVVDGVDGVPRSGIVVTAARANFTVEPERATSGEDGAFVFDSLAVADYTFDLADATLALKDGPISVTVAASGNPPLELVVMQGGVVRGRVIDGALGTGVAGARVLAMPEERRALRRRSDPTDGDGVFELRGLAPGAYTLTAPSTRGYANVGRRDDPVMVQARPGTVVDGIELVLKGGIRIAGHVVLEDGTPVSGAMVRATTKGWQDQTSTDAAGAFVLAGLPTPAEVEIRAGTSTLENASTGPYAIPETGLSDLRIVLDESKAGLIAGVVVDERGRPIAASVLALRKGYPFSMPPPAFEAGPDGRFLLTSLAPGVWDLAVSYGTMSQETLEQVRLSVGQEVRDRRLVLRVGDRLMIRGRVTDDAGKPLRAGIRVEARVESSSVFIPGGMYDTDADGYYEAGPFEPGSYTVIASVRGGEEEIETDVQPGDEGVDFVLRGGTPVSGRVRDERRRAVSDYAIAPVRTSTTPVGGMEWQQVSDAEGRFTVYVERGNRYLYVRAPGYRPELFSIGAIGEEPVDGLEIVLTPGGARIAGEVQTADGSAIAGARVLVGDYAYGVPLAVTQADGAFVIDAIDAETTDLLVVHEMYGETRVAVALEDGKESHVTVVMSALGAIEGVVTSGGRPLPGAIVTFRSATGANHAATTDDAGGFMIERVSPGIGQIEVTPDPSAAPGPTTEVEVISGEVVEVAIEANQ